MIQILQLRELMSVIHMHNEDLSLPLSDFLVMHLH